MNNTLTEFSSNPTFLGFSLSTHRSRELGPDETTYFQYEALIAAVSILFFRLTVYLRSEPRVVRWFFGILLALLSFWRKSYELIIAVELFSYAASWLLLKQQRPSKNAGLVLVVSIAASAAASLLLSHLLMSRKGEHIMELLMPDVVFRLLNYLFPIEEFNAAYNIMQAFAHPEMLRKQVVHLLFVTFHIQVGMGYLGIDFLTEEQNRRNQLIRLDVEKDQSDGDSSAQGTNGAAKVLSASSSKSEGETRVMTRAKRFQRSAPPFILFTALPYMLRIICFGNINKFSFTCVEHEMHRIVRLNEVFDHDNNLAIIAANSATAPSAFGASMSSVVATTYEIINRKFFSLPKVLLLPAVMAKQPMLLVQVFPFIFLSDWIKAWAVSSMTTTIETLRKEMNDIKAVRTKVESFDIKNAELLQRSGQGATKFTQRKWEELTVKAQSREILSDLIMRSKDFFAFMQRNFVFGVLIDCALANLIAMGKISAADIFVFSRAIEDAVDMILMRSRSEAELAQMTTDIARLQELADLWAQGRTERTLMPCTLDTSAQKRVVLRNLHYSRGTASVRADHVELFPGVYALTGANGSGKSTLFRVLMACSTNEQTIDLPDSINLLTPMEPITEADDILRETVCLPCDENDTDVVYDKVCDASGDSDGSCSAATSDAPVESSVHIPKVVITMPSAQVVEISQNFYWPLYSKPIEWIHQDEVVDQDVIKRRVRTIAEHLHSLDFFQPVKSSGDTDFESSTVEETDITSVSEATIKRIQQELMEEKEDWFSNLSGGQKSKVELVRKVFLHEKCPDVLLVDETMAPLDPASKAVVMAKLKDFCKDSIVIVIYHTDVGVGVDADGEVIDCVPSNDFFDKNIHLEHGLLHVRHIC